MTDRQKDRHIRHRQYLDTPFKIDSKVLLVCKIMHDQFKICITVHTDIMAWIQNNLPENSMKYGP